MFQAGSKVLVAKNGTTETFTDVVTGGAHPGLATCDLRDKFGIISAVDGNLRGVTFKIKPPECLSALPDEEVVAVLPESHLVAA